jgi:tetratricopeptide (TPR) repeat protein
MGLAPRHFFVLVLAVVVAVGVFMAPRHDEWFAVMHDEKRHEQIIALLEPTLAGNSSDADVLAKLSRAYAGSGRVRHAAELLERYVELRPDDVDAYGVLADLYRDLGEPSRRMAMLQRSVALAPKPARVMELGGLYHVELWLDEERALLADYAGASPLESGLVLRLAELHVARGDRAAAIRVLMRPDVLAPPRRPLGEQRERLYLAELLATEGRGEEAVRLGRQWLLQWDEAWLANKLLRGVARHASLAEASELAEAVALQHPDIRLYLVKELAAAGTPAVARNLLANWRTANPTPSGNQLAAFISACREQGHPDLVWEAFAEALRRPAGGEIIGRYSEMLADEFGIEALAPFWAHMPPSVLEARPLLAARLAFRERDFEQARRQLARVDLRSLGDSAQHMWLDLLTAVSSPAQAVALLDERQRRGALPPEMRGPYLRLATGLGLAWQGPR